MVLSKMETTWRNCSLEKQPSEISYPNLDIEIRTNRYDDSIVFGTIFDVQPEQTRSAFSFMETQVQGKCCSLKMFFNEEMPIEDLEKLGFEESATNIFRYPHPDFTVSAIRIPLQHEKEWVLQVEKRRKNMKKGIPATACDYSMLFESQLSLSLKEEEVSAS
ncbi:hypothetical protein J2S74_002899 [Evansella vedderi]|uniref:Uncharacterized protein n=1 Tax=Evansella vedderi TaxID=38282 RepID=A0ABT9ZWA7_9BACI|nr:hypothetical protein [Evansella vedderi]MDQ0255517.1 hypothetical protein [Evansella vedderi]